MYVQQTSADVLQLLLQNYPESIYLLVRTQGYNGRLPIDSAKSAASRSASTATISQNSNRSFTSSSNWGNIDDNRKILTWLMQHCTQRQQEQKDDTAATPSMDTPKPSKC
jgi:hypothetical protein